MNCIQKLESEPSSGAFPNETLFLQISRFLDAVNAFSMFHMLRNLILMILFCLQNNFILSSRLVQTGSRIKVAIRLAGNNIWSTTTTLISISRILRCQASLGLDDEIFSPIFGNISWSISIFFNPKPCNLPVCTSVVQVDYHKYGNCLFRHKQSLQSFQSV